MKRATLDIGTNSVRLLVADYEEGVFSNSKKYVEITRLGKGVNETKRLQDDRIKATVEAVKQYKAIAESKGCERIEIMATSAARDAENKDALIDALKNETQLDLDIISGALEAEVGFMGVLAGTNTSSGDVLVIDIGGGSTELIVGNKSGIKSATSLDMGAVRLTGMFVDSDPVSPIAVENMRRFAASLLEEHKRGLTATNFDAVVGIGGTAATFVTMAEAIEVYTREAVHGREVTLDTIKKLNATLLGMTVEEKKQLKGLEAKRADVILAGGIVLETILEGLSLSAIAFSDFDNLEGYMLYKA